MGTKLNQENLRENGIKEYPRGGMSIHAIHLLFQTTKNFVYLYGLYFFDDLNNVLIG
jgi:transposase